LEQSFVGLVEDGEESLVCVDIASVVAFQKHGVAQYSKLFNSGTKGEKRRWMGRKRGDVYGGRELCDRLSFSLGSPKSGVGHGIADQVRCLWTAIASMRDVCYFSFNNLFSVFWQLCVLAMSTGVVPVCLSPF
jgi:hypothetical protein